ncbi:Ribosome biogenesis protein Nop10 [uncultured archaeon]|nr:Ribosome biogenesis protein Nop10 [uncultured archaeon]
MRIRRNRTTKQYTLEDIDPQSGKENPPVEPPKYSPEDPYGRYRRIMKKESEKKEEKNG